MNKTDELVMLINRIDKIAKFADNNFMTDDERLKLIHEIIEEYYHNH